MFLFVDNLHKVVYNNYTMRWTYRQRRYQELLTVPEDSRPEGCNTDSEIATTLGISITTLKGWLLEPGFWEAVSDIAAVYIGRHLHAIYEAMVKQALGGSVQAAKFCRAAVGLENRELAISVRHYDDDRLVVFLPAEKGPPPKMVEAPVVEGKVLASKEIEKEDDLVVVL